MNPVLELARKDLQILGRDHASLFWTVGWPLVMALFFGFIMSGGSRTRSPMRIAVVDEAGTAASARFIARLDSSEAVAVERLPLAEARDAVRRGNKVALIAVPPGFGEGASPFRPDAPALRLGVDPSRRAEAGMLQGILAQASFQVMQEGIGDRGARAGWLAETDSLAEAGEAPAPLAGHLGQLFAAVDSLQSDRAGAGASDTAAGAGLNPVRIEEEPIARESTGQPRSSFDISFPAAILWVFIACAGGFAVSLVTERQEGTLLRLSTSPLSRRHILLGKAMACFTVCLGVAVLLLLLGILGFGVRVGSAVGLAAAVVASAICFTGLMMAFSAAGRTARAVGGISWAVMLVCAMLGGGMIPLIAMPEAMQRVSAVSPMRWSVLAIEGAVWRDFTFAEMLPPLGVLLGIGVVAFAIGARAFRRAEV